MTPVNQTTFLAAGSSHANQKASSVGRFCCEKIPLIKEQKKEKISHSHCGKKEGRKKGKKERKRKREREKERKKEGNFL